MIRSVALALCLSLAASPAFAAGFYFGDNGAKALLQGGAFTAQADDLSALQYNPAGLAQLEGLHAMVDGQVMIHEVAFTRRGTDGVALPCPGGSGECTVRNAGGPFLLPSVGVSYGFKLAGRTFTVGAGAYGPPAVGRYNFPKPDLNSTNRGEYLRTAPQRYALVSNDIFIVYPSLSLSYELVPRKLMVGAVFQLVLSTFDITQAISSQLFEAKTLTEEDPSFDSLIRMKMSGGPGVTGVFGVLYKPLETLGFGVSVRPPVPVKARGTLDIELGRAAKAFNATVMGNQAELQLTLPLEIRVGARWKPLAQLGINADFVYQGWNSVDAIRLTPLDVTLQLGAADPQKVEAVSLEKKWNATFSGRLGATYDFGKWVSAHGGVLFETQSSPPQYTSIDFTHFTRVFVTAGASAHLGPVDVVAGVAFTPVTTLKVTDSQVVAANTDPSIRTVIGNGDFSSGGASIVFGVRGHFLEPKPASPMPEPAPLTPPPDAPTPLPAAEPTPAT